MKGSRVLALIFATSLLSGCGKPTIDASTDESMKATVQKVRESLPESKRAEFDEAIQTLAFSQLNMKTLLAEGVAGVGNLQGKMRDSINGKTGEEVLAEAQRVQAERKLREQQQAMEEIRELEGKRTQAESAREQLKQFVVVRSRFYMQDREYLGKQPVIDLTVRNGTSHTVSRAYFVGTLSSPGRSVPWHQDTFNYQISGGLEPGEEARWGLAPNMFSGWGQVEIPTDAVFTVTVEELDGPNGETIFSTKEFSDQDAKRLAELKKEYGVK